MIEEKKKFYRSSRDHKPGNFRAGCPNHGIVWISGISNKYWLYLIYNIYTWAGIQTIFLALVPCLGQPYVQI